MFWIDLRFSFLRLNDVMKDVLKNTLFSKLEIKKSNFFYKPLINGSIDVDVGCFNVARETLSIFSLFMKGH